MIKTKNFMTFLNFIPDYFIPEFYLSKSDGYFSVAGYFFDFPRDFRTLFVYKNYEVSQQMF